jgi:hypothetical protein
MANSIWSLPAPEDDEGDSSAWLHAALARNAGTAYLRQFGSPHTVKAFRERVTICAYEDLAPYMRRIEAGDSSVLFAGHPVAYELTGGSSGGSKLIPYSREGLRDFQRCVLPWLAHTVRRHRISGRAYFSISPVAREPRSIGAMPVGLSDAAYLGDGAGEVIARRSAVPLEVANLRDVSVWRERTLEYLVAAKDLELISVWSPTFLLRLFEGISDTRAIWPGLKVISCWASGPAQRYVCDLERLFPQAVIEPKGLVSTEAVVTVPDEQCRPSLVHAGFFEFLDHGRALLDTELKPGGEYEMVVTTASGLYRYATGDRVRYEGRNRAGRPVLEFVGRDSLTSDLVGEKLTESFVGKCLEAITGFAMLVPDVQRPGYVLIGEQLIDAGKLEAVDNLLRANPQYAYARRLGQLAPLRSFVHPQPFAVVERLMQRRGVRLADVKPAALRSEAFWLAEFEKGVA